MTEKRYTHFDTPTQVAFWDYDGEHWAGGIAIDDIIICGCCGSIIPIDEIYEFAPEDKQNPICAYSDWVDLTAEIIGFPYTPDECDEDETDCSENFE